MSGTNTGNTWSATSGGQTVVSGQPYGPYQFGPFPISGGPVAMMFTDDDNDNCFAPLTVNPPTNCSDQCLITAILHEPGGIACYNNNTPYDPTDDVFFIIVEISGFNNSGFWVSNEPGYTTPTPYGLHAFGPYPISGGNKTITVRDANDPDCEASVFAPAPPPCSSECLIDALVGVAECNDNGTPSDPGDDTFTVQVTVVGIHNFSPLGWRQVFPNGTFGLQGQYGQPTTFGPYPISGGPVDIRVRDRGNAGCTVEFTLTPPAPCSDTPPTAALGDFVWHDSNGNGIQDGNEPGVAGVTVTLTSCSGAFVAQQTTNADGEYLFTGLDPNVDYIVTFSNLPAGFQFVTPNAGNNDAVDSDANPTTGSTTCIDLDPGETDLTWDAGIHSVPACDIEADLVDVNCASETTFTFSLTATNSNSNAGWTAYLNNTIVASGAYGSTATSIELPSNGQTLTIVVRDNADPTCSTTLTVIAPSDCDDDCSINVSITNVICNDNGTPNNDDDDTYTFSLLLTGQTGTWTASNGATGIFGVPQTFGPYLTGQDITFTVVGDANSYCIAAIYVSSPPPCSEPECTIEPQLISVLCNDNGTPDNDDDDKYTFTVLVTGQNGSLGWVALLPNGTPAGTGFYGVTASFGPYNIADGNTTLTFVDWVNANCNATLTIQAPQPCSNATCSLTAQVTDVDCNTNGTFNFTVVVTGANAGTTWTTADGSVSGTFGQPVVFQNYPANGQQINIAIQAANDASCQTTISLTAPTNCTDNCTVQALVDNIVCNDNGTPNDSSDDTFTFQLMVQGGNAGYGWTSTIGVNGQYNTMVTFGPYDISDGDINFVVFDVLNDNCMMAVYVNAPEPCSGTDCVVQPQVLEVVCNDNGTDNDPSDDTYTVLVSVNGAFGSPAWYAFDQLGELYTGSYGDEVVFGPYNISDGEATFEFHDMMNDECGVSISVPAPAPCSTGDCQINAIVTSNICNDNDTPLDASDDTFTFVVTVNGSFTSPQGWTASNGTTGAYGQPVTFGPFPLGAVTITFTDKGNNNCTTSVTVNPPLPELNCPDDVERIINADGELVDLICTDVDSIFNNPASLALTGQPEIVNGCGIDEISFSDELIENSSCDEIIIRRTFTATTILGQVLTCQQEIIIRRAIFNDVVPPADATFGCTDAFQEDANGHPHPDVTGYPAVQTAFGLHLLDPDYCNLTATYADSVVSVCSGTYTIYRNWTITNACDPNNSDTTLLQVIEVLDTTGPVVECPLTTHYCPILEQDIMLFHSDPFECTGTVDVPWPVVTDVCSNDWTVVTQIVAFNGTTVLHVINPNDPRVIPGLAIGDYFFRYIVTDDCGNTTVKDCIFRVADLEEPVAICHDGLNVSLGGGGLARLYTQHINNLSYDNCGIESIELRRYYVRDPETCDSLLVPTWSAWGSYVDFTCCDAGQYVMVELRVTDIHGNVNSCWSNILVEDKTLPYCTGLPDSTVSCEVLPFNFNPYDTLQLQQLFGVPHVVDNCSAEAIELAPVVNLNDCGNYGTIVRRFVAIDAVGNISNTVFDQLVTITSSLNYEIRFPKDTETDCANNADTVALYRLGCDSITVTNEDVYLPALNDECYRIQRTYHVINWCEWNGIAPAVVVDRNEDCDALQGEEHVWVLRRANAAYIDRDSLEGNLLPAAGTKGTSCDGTTNPNGYWQLSPSTGYWKYTQIITVHDTLAPAINFETPLPFCTDSIECEGLVTYPFHVIEHCSPDSLVITVRLDADADGDIDALLNNAQVLHGEYPHFTVIGEFPIGNHAFVVTVEDACGNETSATMPFEVVDCYIADPICFSGLIVNLAPVAPNTDADGDGDIDEAAVTIFASDLAECNVPECSLPLRFSVNRVGETPDINQTSLVLTCDDRYSLTVEVYVWDSANNPYSIQPDGSVGGPNYKFCEALVFVQDPDNLCDDCEQLAELEGVALTVFNKPIENAQMTLSSSVLTESTLTNENGQYGFDDVLLGHDYTITPLKDDDHSNGVTTQDVIIIRRHVQGLQLIATPQHRIAADADNSQTITMADVQEVRDLILGDIPAYTNNTSWRFVDRSYQFPVSTNPWFEAFPESISLDNLSGCLQGLDFTGIKIGDVNNTVVPNLNDPGAIDTRQGGLIFNVEDQQLVAGQEYRVAFTSRQLAEILGYQYTLHFDPQAVEVVGIDYGLAKAEHFGWNFVNDGMITTSWNWHDDNVRASEDAVFTLILRARSNTRLSDILGIGSGYTKEEAYGINGETREVSLVFSDKATAATAQPYKLYQNQPNPFNDETVIGFELPEATQATLFIHDASGKLLQLINGYYEAGYHQVKLNRENLPTGVLSYTLEAGNYRATKRMLITD